MRAKLALLVATAVVFAPGWPVSDGSAADPAGEALAGRILAPTVDEATASVEATRLERAQPRVRPWKTIAPRSAPPSLLPPALLWGSLLAVVAAAALAPAPSGGSPRAPPHVLTV